MKLMITKEYLIGKGFKENENGIFFLGRWYYYDFNTRFFGLSDGIGIELKEIKDEQDLERLYFALEEKKL